MKEVKEKHEKHLSELAEAEDFLEQIPHEELKKKH
jgi:hypothetical protein